MLAWTRLPTAEILCMDRVVLVANASSIYPYQVPDLNCSYSSNQHNILSRNETGVASHCAVSWTNSAWVRSCMIKPCRHRQWECLSVFIAHHTWNTRQQRLFHLRFDDLEAFFSLAHPVKPISGEPIKPSGFYFENNASYPVTVFFVLLSGAHL